MTTMQKIIKYLALAFALFLTVSIISGICGALFTVAHLLSGKSETATENVEHEVGNNFTSLSIDISAAELEIKSGEKFQIETNHKCLTYKENGETLEIKETKPFFTSNSGGMKVILTLPESFVFDYADINAGAGSVRIDELATGTLKIELGAGKLNASRLKAAYKAEIDGGAGSITINSGYLNNAEIDMGVGQLNFTGELDGNSSIDYGIGQTNLVLVGNSEDYQIELDKGIGEAYLEGKKMRDDSVYGVGNRRIGIDGGIGKLNITFKEKPDPSKI